MPPRRLHARVARRSATAARLLIVTGLLAAGSSIAVAADAGEGASRIILPPLSERPPPERPQLPADTPLILPPVQIIESSAARDPFATGAEASGLAGRRVDLRDPAFLTLRTLPDLFALEPGVVARDYLGGADAPLLSIRGSGSQSVPSSRGVTLFLDGIPWQRADGEFLSGALDLGHLAGVRVWRGADANAAGATSLGGLVDFRTPGAEGPASLRARLVVGGGGRISFAAAGSWNVGSDLLSSAASAERVRGFRAHHVQERQFLHQDWSRRTTGGETRVSLVAARQRFEVPAGLNPAAASSAPDSVSPGLVPGINSGPAILRDDPERAVSVVRLSVSTLQHPAPGRPTRAAYAYVLASNDDFRRPIGFGDEADDSVSAGVGASLSGVSPSHAHRWHVRLQADLLENANAFFHNDRGRRGARFSRNDLAAFQVLLAGSNEWRPHPDVSVLTALQAGTTGRRSRDRHDAATRPTLQVGPVPPAAGGPTLPAAYPRSDTSFSWRRTVLQPAGTLQWRPRPGWLVRAGASLASEAPTLSDFFLLTGGSPNAGPTRFSVQPLRAQRSSTVESGFRVGGAAWSVEATVYRSEVRDELLAYDQNGAEVTINSRSPTFRRGLEAVAAARLGKGWWRPSDETTLRVAWTAQDFRFRDDPEYGWNRIAGQPREIVSAVVSHRPDPRSGLELAAHGQPRPTHIDHANTRTYDRFTRLDLRAHRAIGRSWTVFAEFRNLANSRSPVSSLVVRRVASDLQATLFPGNPRHLVAGFSWSK
jgi:iron complex outermembrane recepter protein